MKGEEPLVGWTISALCAIGIVIAVIGIVMVATSCGPPPVQRAESASVDVVELARYHYVIRITDRERGVTCYVGDEWGQCFNVGP